MAAKRMPNLSSTGRRYLDETRRVRLASPGIERFVPERRRAPRMIAAAVALVLALVGAMLWLSRAG
jgi:hypothetical protein